MDLWTYWAYAFLSCLFSTCFLQGPNILKWRFATHSMQHPPHHKCNVVNCWVPCKLHLAVFFSWLKIFENVEHCWTMFIPFLIFGDFVCFGVVPLTPMSLVHQVTQTFHVRRCGTSTSTLVLRTWPGSWLQNLRARFVLGFEFETVGSQHVHFFGKQEMSCDSSGLTFHGSNPASAHNIINTCARAQPTPFRKLAFVIDECWIHMNHMNNTCPVPLWQKKFLEACNAQLC